MRAISVLLLASGCNFLTTDLEDQAPVRTIDAPEAASQFGHAIAALPAGKCGAAGSLIVAGQTVDGPQLYLVTFGDAGGESVTRLNDFHVPHALSAAEQIVAMDPADDGSMSIEIETDLHKVRVRVDSDCDNNEDTACDDYCNEGELDDATTEITGDTDEVKLFAAEDPVLVTGDSAAGTVTVAGGRGPVVIPEGAPVAGLGQAVTRMPFDGPAGPTEELAVGGNRFVLLFFRTGFAGDCDPREGAPGDVACGN